MTRARRELVSPETTPYYHCICRCVRRAFICGEDHLTGKNYEHRKHWVPERLRELQAVFLVEICAYAVMSNHYHLVVRLNREKATGLSDEAVAERWGKLFQVPMLVSRYIKGLSDTAAERKAAQTFIEQWRERLADLSWYMRCLNEHLARRANEEDGCTGRVWEGRFKSQALLNEAAVLTCMSYVDLNPVRGGSADAPEESDFTSIQQRIFDRVGKLHRANQPENIALMPLGADSDHHPNRFTFSTQDYFELVDWAGRAVRDDKRGTIAADIPPILERLGLNSREYLRHVASIGAGHDAAVLGNIQRVRRLADRLGRKFIRGVGASKQLYARSA